jgi:hypothetical protein
MEFEKGVRLPAREETARMRELEVTESIQIPHESIDSWTYIGESGTEWTGKLGEGIILLIEPFLQKSSDYSANNDRESKLGARDVSIVLEAHQVDDVWEAGSHGDSPTRVM